MTSSVHPVAGRARQVFEADQQFAAAGRDAGQRLPAATAARRESESEALR